jgi:hypothetical protein
MNEKIAVAVSAALKAHYGKRKDCCISAARALTRVFDYFRIPNRPLVVTALVFNPALTERIEREESESTNLEVLRDGEWSVGLGDERAPSKTWSGHIVVALTKNGLLADLTLDQASRPEHNITLPAPALAEASPAFLEGMETTVGVINGCLVVYRPRPADRSYEQSPDWTLRERTDPIVQGAIKRLSYESNG